MSNEAKAREVWSKIEFDLKDRSGIKHGFNDIDDDVLEELRNTQISFIAQALESAPQGAWPGDEASVLEFWDWCKAQGRPIHSDISPWAACYRWLTSQFARPAAVRAEPSVDEIEAASDKAAEKYWGKDLVKEIYAAGVRWALKRMRE
jgi:hypothetical protein